jgi:ribonuclease PH
MRRVRFTPNYTRHAEGSVLAEFGETGGNAKEPLERALRSLAERAVARNSPYSDNTSAAAVRWQGP